MNKIKYIFASLGLGSLVLLSSPYAVLAAGGGGSTTHPGPGAASGGSTTSSGGVFNPCNDTNVTNSEICANSQGTTTLFGAGGIWNRILNTITFVIGAVAVLMILIGAVRYALSAGDQSQVTAAKNTILYAAVALVVAVMANAIVNFVLTNI